MPKISPLDKSASKTIQAKTKSTSTNDPKIYNARWWLLDSQQEIASTIMGVVKQIKQMQNYRERQANIFSRLYCNTPMYGMSGLNQGLDIKNRLPVDRPTLNVVQSCTDALVSRMVQSKPKPMFLTEGGNYKKQRLAKDLNKFIDGEFYACRAYEMGEQALRDSCILGDGVIKIYEDDENRVCLERVLETEILVDEVDGKYGFPQQLHQVKIADRDVIAALFPKKASAVRSASSFYFDSTGDASQTIASQIMVVESWHLPSAHGAGDGRHVIAIENAVLLDEEYQDADYPFVKLSYTPRILGYWSQGLVEQLMGIQVAINRLLYSIDTALHLCAVPKWLVEDGSKVVSSHINNQIGGIIKYQGMMPELKVFQCLPPELYQQLERLVTFAYQQSGISMLSAASQKPSGLNSGAALREYDDLQSDRFAYLSLRYEKFYLDLAHKMFKMAKRIAEREGKYETIYPGKKGLSRVEFPKYDLKADDYIIQAFPASALSKNPAQRKQEIVDLMQAGLIDPDEGRRLLDYPDLQQVEDLLNAPEERILKVLDEIVDDGNYNPPEPTMDLQKAMKLVVQYQNRYANEELEPDKMAQLADFQQQINQMQQATMPPPMPGGMPGEPQAAPMPQPTSPMVPNVPSAA